MKMIKEKSEMYKTVEKFLKDPNPVEYDIKDEYVFGGKDFKNKDVNEAFKAFCSEASKDVIEEPDPIKKFLKYKMYGDISNFDCDSSNGSCELTNDIYSKLAWKNDDPQCSDWGGDTMNSFWTTYKIALQIFYPDNFLTGDKKVVVTNKRPNIPYLLSNGFDKYPEVNQNKAIRRFAELTHTIGNFTLVPPGYNCGRYERTKDYWDLSLLDLQEAYGDKWLRKMNGLFFLTEYFTNSADESSELEVSLFFAGHSLKKLPEKPSKITLKGALKKEFEGVFANPLPGDGLNLSNIDEIEKAKAQLQTCVQAINTRIESRGETMVAELKKIKYL